MNFSNKLKKLRDEQGLTQEELASKIYVSRSLIARYENGSTYPTNANLEKLALFFGVKLSDLIDKEDTLQMSLETLKLAAIVNRIITCIIITTCSLFSILSPLPINKVSHHVYPIPPGQTSPSIEFYYTSILSASLKRGNVFVLVTIIVCLINITLAIFSLVCTKKDKVFLIRVFCYILFVINLFLILFSVIIGISSNNLNY